MAKMTTILFKILNYLLPPPQRKRHTVFKNLLGSNCLIGILLPRLKRTCMTFPIRL